MQKDGLRFERKVQRLLYSHFPRATIYCNQWVRFEDDGGVGMASADAILLHNDTGVIFEVKRTKCEDAELQLMGLYLQLCHQLFPRQKSWKLVEIYMHWHGPLQENRVLRVLTDVFDLPSETIFFWAPDFRTREYYDNRHW